MSQSINEICDTCKKRLNAAVRTPLVLALSTLSGIVGSGWVGDALKGECIRLFHLGACQPTATIDLYALGISLALFAIGAAGVAAATRQYLPVRHLKHGSTAARKALVMAVSTPNDHELLDGGREVQCLKLPAGCDDCKNAIKLEEGQHGCRTFTDGHLLLSGNIATDIEKLNGTRFNLQQVLRALSPHLGDNLKAVRLLGSPGEKGSALLLEDYKQLIRRYAPHASVTVQPPVDFEQIDAMYRAINAAVDGITDQDALKESDIVVDVTGGQKTASIAAALATLHRGKLEFQYVSMLPPNNVLTFNMVAETPLKLNG